MLTILNILICCRCKIVLDCQPTLNSNYNYFLEYIFFKYFLEYILFSYEKE